jgi:osmotically-inducible protein OsmY
LNTSGLGAQTGLTGPQLNTELGAMSATIGQGGFVGASDTAGRFVGNATAGQQSIQATDIGGGGGNQFGGRTNTANQRNNNQQGFGNQARRTVRPQQKIAFTYPQPALGRIQTNLTNQFERLSSSRPELEGVQIVMVESELVLRGSVGSEDDKKLAAILARMEPGVRTVKNELTIASN